MRKNEILNKYNVTEATLRNWKKLKYISDLNNITESDIENILKNKIDIRRNKRNSLRNMIPISYVEDDNIICIIEKILNLKKMYEIDNKQVLNEVIRKILKDVPKEISKELEKVLGKRTTNVDFINEFNTIVFEYDKDNDLLGCLYMSLLSVGKKDTNGIFYTPYKVVNEIVSSINFDNDQKIIDPGCGSGNFLIRAFREMKKLNIPIENIINNLYGYDVDEIAVLLSKINIYILDKNVNYNQINIFVKDFINEDIKENFDIIIGNPPWGKKYTKNEKDAIKSKYGLKFAKQDSFSQFILKGFSILNENGILGFVLPSSILNIAIHKEIRGILLENNIKIINRIGRKFKEIVTDVIIIIVEKGYEEKNICKYDSVEILQRDFKNNLGYNFLISDDIAKRILDKIKNFPSFHLDNEEIKYALGIVTGNNGKYLLDNKVDNAEKIISGKEVDKYKVDYNKINKYIVFDKNSFQQVVDEKLYRSKNKIIYKFIGKKLCFAVEPRGMLTLNSANVIVFPKSYNLWYISSILNSRITQLFFEEMYDTHKLLKNHIKSFYIPKLNEEVIEKITLLAQNAQPQTNYNEEIDDIIYNELKLTKEEIKYVKDRFI